MTVKEAREIVLQQLSEILVDHNFGFLDRNNFPISNSQEGILKIWDLVKFGFITITRPKRFLQTDITDGSMTSITVEETPRADTKKKKKSTATTIPATPSDKDIDTPKIIDENPMTTLVTLNPSGHGENSSHAILGNPTTASTLVLANPLHSLTPSKPILISYVRAEGTSFMKIKISDNEVNILKFIKYFN